MNWGRPNRALDLYAFISIRSCIKVKRIRNTAFTRPYTYDHIFLNPRPSCIVLAVVTQPPGGVVKPGNIYNSLTLPLNRLKGAEANPFGTTIIICYRRMKLIHRGRPWEVCVWNIVGNYTRKSLAPRMTYIYTAGDYFLFSKTLNWITAFPAPFFATTRYRFVGAGGNADVFLSAGTRPVGGN